MWGKGSGKGQGKEAAWGGWGGGKGGKGMGMWGMPPWAAWGPPPWAMAQWGDAPKKGGKGSKGRSNLPPSKKVFVGGLPKQPSEDTVIAYFSEFGTVTDVKIMKNEAGESRGYCFVTFEDLEDAKKVYDNYDHNEIDGKWVDCKPSDGEVKGKPGDWYCPMCGDLVFAWRAQCNMCGFGGDGYGMGMVMTVPPHQKGKPGDWTCDACGELVFSAKDACDKCGKKKSKHTMRVGQKEGDWTCTNCGDLVFASKEACSMCGTPKQTVESTAMMSLKNDADSGKGGYGAAKGGAKGGAKGARWGKPY